MAEEDVEKRALEQQLKRAVDNRIQHFKDQANSLTLESVRRLLEKDLGLEKLVLDAHKRFIRQYLEKKMDDADDVNSNRTTENVDKDVQLIKEEEKASPKQEEVKSDPKKASVGNEETMEDSPIMGVLTPKPAIGTQGTSLSESTIEKAIWERADHIQANSEKISLAGVRRLLEEDLGLVVKTLDAFKEFISQQVHEVLQSPKSVKDGKKKGSETLKSKTPKKVYSEEGSDTSQSGSESCDKVRDKMKSRKEAVPGRNIKKSEQLKKRKISNNVDIEVSNKKQKTAKRQKVDNNSNEDGSLSDGNSQSSIERPTLHTGQQRKEKSAPGYGKQVENLKSIIKACGMSVPPSIYKKAKQVSDNERETFLVKELEGILSREGLSKSPSEKEIKDCRKRKDQARELEGIDMSNIISSSRRRSTFSFVVPEKPEIQAKKDKVDSKNSKKKENNDKDDTKEEKDSVDEEEVKEKEENEVEEEEVEEDEEEEDDEEEDESEDFDEDDNIESD